MPSRPRRKSPDRPRPTWRRRAFYFVLGAALGATIGYGFIASGPDPNPSILEPTAMKLIGGLAAVCGAIAASSPDRFWRRSRDFGSIRDRDRR
jgi:hypothetical protein